MIVRDERMRRLEGRGFVISNELPGRVRGREIGLPKCLLCTLGSVPLAHCGLSRRGASASVTRSSLVG